MQTKLVKIPAGIPSSVITEAIKRYVKLSENDELDTSDVSILARKLDGIGGLKSQSLLKTLRYMLRPGFKTLRQAPQDVAEIATKLLVSILDELASDRLSLTRIAKDVKNDGKKMDKEHVAALAAWAKVSGETDEKVINAYFDKVSDYLVKTLSMTSAQVDDLLADMSVYTSKDGNIKDDIENARKANPELFKVIQEL